MDLGRHWIGILGFSTRPALGPYVFWKYTDVQAAHLYTLQVWPLGVPLLCSLCVRKEPTPHPHPIYLASPWGVVYLHCDSDPGFKAFMRFGVCLIDGISRTPYGQVWDKDPSASMVSRCFSSQDSLAPPNSQDPGRSGFCL